MRSPKTMLLPVVLSALCLQACVVETGDEIALDVDAAPLEEMVTPFEIFGTAHAECTFFKCTRCPITAPECHIQCIWTGNCPTRCQVVEMCNEGFVWSERACRCVPDRF